PCRSRGRRHARRPRVGDLRRQAVKNARQMALVRATLSQEQQERLARVLREMGQNYVRAAEALDDNDLESFMNAVSAMQVEGAGEAMRDLFRIAAAVQDEGVVDTRTY